MQPAHTLYRLSNIAKGLQEAHVERVRTAIRDARRMLSDHPSPDTFAGRKTQEPFPCEEDS